MADLEQENMLHLNTNYVVVFIPEDERDRDCKGRIMNFEVRHRKWDTCEFCAESLPIALSMAEYMNRILEEKSYMDKDGEVELVFSSDFDDEDGGPQLQ